MKTSTLYSCPHPEIEKKLTSAIERGCSQSDIRPQLFFRADDIGVPSRNFSLLITSFKEHNLPLCLATVPTWITRKRLIELQNQTGKNNSQWCWHQHGRKHLNYERTGKKQEFGPARTEKQIWTSLQQGQKRLDGLLGSELFPIFTPPWNRCSATTLDALPKLGFKAISRSRGASPTTAVNFPDFQVNVDLHTQKELSPVRCMERLLTEIEDGLASGHCGLMIHHQRMNRAAFTLLDLLLNCLRRHRKIDPVHFGEMISQ